MKKKKPIILKKILKKSKVSYKLPDRNIENIWEDENKFFRGLIKNEF